MRPPTLPALVAVSALPADGTFVSEDSLTSLPVTLLFLIFWVVTALFLIWLVPILTAA